MIGVVISKDGRLDARSPFRDLPFSHIIGVAGSMPQNVRHPCG